MIPQFIQNKFADGSVKEHRRLICSTCPKKTKEAFTGVELCSKCGCVIMAKTALTHAVCPEGKW